MSQASYTTAAQSHEAAANEHKAAAALHEKGQHAEATKKATSAMEMNETAHKASTDAMSKSKAGK
jgi:hypothetical protein